MKHLCAASLHLVVCRGLWDIATSQYNFTPPQCVAVYCSGLQRVDFLDDSVVLGVAMWCSELHVRYCCVAIQRHTNPHKQQLLCAEEQVTPSLAHSCPCTYNYWWQQGVDSLNHSVVQSVAECCRVLQCVAVCCSVLQCVAVCSSVLQCVAVCCKELQKVESLDHDVLQYVAVCCSVLQCVAVCCSVLQCVAVCSSVL